MKTLTYTDCELCPRMCHINRTKTTGFCGGTSVPKAARAALHHWEEPCISGSRGSGTIFFSGCTLRCCYCQNHTISSMGFGKEISVQQLADIFLNLQGQGAHNINLVTPTQYIPSILPALDLVKNRLTIPVVYNCGGYERLEIIQALNDYVDIWLPDFKYHSSALSASYSQAGDYFSVAGKAIRQMIRQTGSPRFAPSSAGGISANTFKQVHDPDMYSPETPLMQSGVIIRHMVLPGAKDDSIRLLHWIKNHLPENGYFISLLSQYTPFHRSEKYPEINRRITTYEYHKVLDTAIELGLVQGFMQQKSSAKEEYTPLFDLEGIE